MSVVEVILRSIGGHCPQREPEGRFFADLPVDEQGEKMCTSGREAVDNYTGVTLHLGVLDIATNYM